MKFQNAVVIGIFVTSTLFTFGCSGDDSSSANKSEQDETSTRAAETDSTKILIDKYGECQKGNEGQVEDSFLCQNEKWRHLDCDSWDNQVDRQWCHLGSCTDAEDGTIQTTTSLSSPTEVASFFCHSHTWTGIASSKDLPSCKGKTVGQVVYLESGSRLVCSEKQGWREANAIEAPTPYNLLALEDSINGPCTAEKVGKMASIFDEYRKYFKCADNKWNEITHAEYEYGDCNKTFKDSIVTTGTTEKFICDGTFWRQLDMVETGLGICTAERQYEVGASAYTAGSYVCDNSHWRNETPIETKDGLCIKKTLDEKLGISDSAWDHESNKYLFYTCDSVGSIGWRGATSAEILKVRLGSCFKLDTKTIKGITYFCNYKEWREATDLEMEAGFCFWELRDSVYLYGHNDYICDQSTYSWRIAKPIEKEFGACYMSKYMDSVLFQETPYRCEDNAWRPANEVEQTLGFCDDRHYNDVGNIGETQYICQDNEWVVIDPDE